MVIVTYCFRSNLLSNHVSGKQLPTDRPAHATAFDGPVVDHWLAWKIAQTANARALQARSADLNL